MIPRLPTAMRHGLALLAVWTYAPPAGYADAGAPARDPLPATSAHADAPKDAQTALMRDVEALLDHLRQGGGLDNLSDDNRQRVLQAVLAELGYAAPPTEMPDALTEGADEEEPSGPRVLELADWCLYIRLPEVSEAAAQALKEAMDKQNPNSTPWTIVDLRQANGGDPESIEAIKPLLEARRKPLMVLVGAGTRRAAERLVGALRNDQAAVTIGDPTPGYPYESRQLELPSGLTVAVPDFSTGNPAARLVVEPDITVAYSGHGLEPDVFDQLDEGLRRDLLRDPPVQRAMDTLTAVRAFAEPHF